MVITGPQKQEATFGVIGWWSSNRAVLQESCVQSEVTIFHLGGGSSSVEELKRHCYAYFFEQEPGCFSRLYHHLIVSPLFLYFLPFLISNCLNLPFGTQGRSRRLNLFSLYFTVQQICTPESPPHRVLLSFNLGNRATMTVITSCQNGAQDCLSLEKRH